MESDPWITSTCVSYFEPKKKKLFMLSYFIALKTFKLLFNISGGLHPGDIITHINGKQVSSTSDIYTILAEKGKPLDTIVQRGMEKLRLRIEPEEIEEE